MPACPELHPIRRGLFTTAEALGVGWTPDRLARAVRKGEMDRLRRGVYRAPVERGDGWAAREDALVADGVAAALTNPSARISHTTAALLARLAVWTLPEAACLTVVPHFVGDIAGAHLHRAALAAERIRTIASVGFTDVAQAVVDIGREQGPLACLVTADAALHLGRTTVDELRTAVGACRGWPGVRSAREAIEFADPRAESPLESASRYLTRGLVPFFDIQTNIFDRFGRHLGRADFYSDEFGVVGEVDGMTKYDSGDPTVLRDEKSRQNDFEDAGLVVVRWGASDLKPLQGVISKINRAIAQAQRRTEPRRWIAIPT